MAINRMSLLDLIHKSGLNGDVDFLREGLKVLAEAIMELEVAAKTGAEHYERTATRTVYRNGYRERDWDTRVGTLDVRIPKLREGSYFPSILEPRKKAEKALSAVLQQAYVLGVSTRKVDDLVKALGISGVSKSEVSRVCEDLDDVVSAFRNRPLEADYPYLWLDATYLKVRENGRVLSSGFVTGQCRGCWHGAAAVHSKTRRPASSAGFARPRLGSAPVSGRFAANPPHSVHS